MSWPESVGADSYTATVENSDGHITTCQAGLSAPATLPDSAAASLTVRCHCGSQYEVVCENALRLVSGLQFWSRLFPGTVIVTSNFFLLVLI